MLSKKIIGTLIKDAREIKSQKMGINYTQKMLAKDTGKTQSSIGDIESGRTSPSITLLSKICKACGVNLSFFEDNDNLNTAIDKFIKLQLPDVDDITLCKMREELKQDPHAKITYIYKYLDDYDFSNCDKNPLNNLLSTPEDVIMFALKNPTIINFLGLDINNLDNLEQTNIVQDLLSLAKLASYKYKK